MNLFFRQFLLSLCITGSCVSCSAPETKSGEAAKTPAAVTANGTNHLSMKVNGTAWQADHDIIAVFHPKGYNNAILISGKRGANDKTEQAFNLNLYNAPGTGVFDFAQGNRDNSEVQLANLSDEHYLYGNVLGFSFHVRVTKASQNPTVLEAGFEGTLTGNSGDSVKITDGKFYYHE